MRPRIYLAAVGDPATGRSSRCARTFWSFCPDSVGRRTRHAHTSHTNWSGGQAYSVVLTTGAACTATPPAISSPFSTQTRVSDSAIRRRRTSRIWCGEKAPRVQAARIIESALRCGASRRRSRCSPANPARGSTLRASMSKPPPRKTSFGGIGAFIERGPRRELPLPVCAAAWVNWPIARIRRPQCRGVVSCGVHGPWQRAGRQRRCARSSRWLDAEVRRPLCRDSSRGEGGVMNVLISPGR